MPLPTTGPTTPAPTLTDGVVTLRAHRAEDLDRVLEQCRDPLSQEWTTVPVPYTEAHAHGFLHGILPTLWAEGSEWAFALDVDGRFAGTVSLRHEGPGRAEIAYGAHPDVRGSGAVDRGLRLLLEWGFAERDLRTVIWWANRGNWASRRAAWRLGFSVEGSVRAWLDHRGELRDGWVGTLRRDDAREPRTTWLDLPDLAGDGLRLRALRETDLDRVATGLADATTRHWLAFLPRDAGEYREVLTERAASGTGVIWAVADAADRFVATTGLYRLVAGREAELGYWTHPDVRGTGVARRAAVPALDHGFTTLGLDRVTAYAAAGNSASIRVLESLGMSRTGVQRRAARTGDGRDVDLVGYDLLAEEWRSRRHERRSTTSPAAQSSAPTTDVER